LLVRREFQCVNGLEARSFSAWLVAFFPEKFVIVRGAQPREKNPTDSPSTY